MPNLQNTGLQKTCLFSTLISLLTEAPSWGLWTAWSKCSATCNKIGTRFRGRDCIQSDCPDGSPCIGEWREEHSCYGPCVTPEGGTHFNCDFKNTLAAFC